MAENKTIYCEKCGGVIKNSYELTVTTRFLSIVPYHDRCFASQVKGISTMFVGTVPINGSASNVGTVFAVIIGIIVLFIPELRYISIVALITILIRFYAWFNYERHL